MNLLFELPPPIKPRKERCRQCAWIYPHQYNPRWKYCPKQRSNRTASGHARIKANDYACDQFTPKQKNQ